MARRRAIGSPAVVSMWRLRGRIMRYSAQDLRPDEEAMLVLLSMEPLSQVPDMHVKTARRLVALGLAIARDGRWYPTGRGLERVGYRVH